MMSKSLDVSKEECFISCPLKMYSFPLKLFDVIEMEDKSVIDWISGGNGFKVKDAATFRDIILPKYFRHNKITSFNRQLNLYGFKRIKTGKDIGAYFHKDFVRGRRELATDIKINKDNNSSKTLYEFRPSQKMVPIFGESSISAADVLHHASLFGLNSKASKIGLHFRNSDQFTGERYVGMFESQEVALEVVEAILRSGNHLASIEAEKHAQFLKKDSSESKYQLLVCNSDQFTGPRAVCNVDDRVQGYEIVKRILDSDNHLEAIKEMQYGNMFAKMESSISGVATRGRFLESIPDDSPFEGMGMYMDTKQLGMNNSSIAVSKKQSSSSSSSNDAVSGLLTLCSYSLLSSTTTGVNEIPSKKFRLNPGDYTADWNAYMDPDNQPL